MGEQLFLERIVWFDNEIKRLRYPNAPRLAEQFELAQKTAQRSIEYFRERLLAPLQYDYRHKGYFYTNPDFQIPLSRITEKELLALLISRKLISEASAGPLSEDLGKISKKLAALLQGSLLGRSRPEDAFSFRWKTHHQANTTVFNAVTSALLRGTLLTISYRPPYLDTGVTRTVEPHHMVNYMGNWHLIAFCHLRNDWRDFMLSRMTNCHETDKAFTVRPSDEWQPYLLNSFGIYQNKNIFNVIVRFSPERSRWIQEEIWHEGQMDLVHPDGSLQRTIPVSHQTEIIMEILQHGSHAEVLEPQWLRDIVAQELRAAAKKYER
ncbi:MAG: hypothetical protein BWK76_25835 [Desulfobulbaceae bacterium A2]|nr:MAG: hypothetical protein BWK76_25835 [Desulfobulbaceae bacterium A2]